MVSNIGKQASKVRTVVCQVVSRQHYTLKLGEMRQRGLIRTLFTKVWAECKETMRLCLSQGQEDGDAVTA